VPDLGISFLAVCRLYADGTLAGEAPYMDTRLACATGLRLSTAALSRDRWLVMSRLTSSCAVSWWPGVR
jgi:hypothetical protein